MSTINIIKQTISLDITTAIRRMAGVHNISEPDQLAQELLVHLGIVDRDTVPIKATVEVAPPPPLLTSSGSDADVEAESVGKKERSRMVSAKQKKPVLEQFPDTAEKKVMDVLLKGYKAATQEEIDSLMTPEKSKENTFLLYVQKVRAVAVAVAPAAVVPVAGVKEKKTKAKAKKEVGRVKFNATELKIFKKIVESAGSTVTDVLKQEFVDYVAAKSEEEFAVVALEGHMRAFVESKKQGAEPKAGNGEMTPSEYDASRKGKGKGPEYDTSDAEAGEDEDEDLVEFTHNEETLLKGVVSGKIFRSTAEAGDVQIGVCGQGQFKDVKRVA
jgi:hypothetical protein